MILHLFLYRVTWLVVKTDTFLCSKDSLVRVQNTANTELETLKSTNDEDVYYNLQVIDFNRNFFRFDIFSPMMTGYIYTRYLPSKKYTYFTYQNVDNYNVINFNMKVLDGYPKLYFDYCETFPNCEYDQEKIEQLVNDGSI